VDSLLGLIVSGRASHSECFFEHKLAESTPQDAASLIARITEGARSSGSTHRYRGYNDALCFDQEHVAHRWWHHRPPHDAVRQTQLPAT
jgi:hypothetical protein